MKFPLRDRPFPGARLTHQQCDDLERLTDSVIAATLDEYRRFVSIDKRVMSKRIWKPVRTRESVTVYKQIAHEPRLLSSIQTRQPAEDTPWTMPKFVAVGTLAGSLDDIMYGVVTPDAPSIAVKTSYVDDELLDSAVLHKIRGATPQDPFRYIALKWIAMGHSMAVNTVVWPRDFVIAESTGTTDLPGGGRLGYHTIHSVELPQCPELVAHSIVRARLSNCYLYHELHPGVVETYMMTYGEPGGNPPESIAIMSAANSLIGNWKAMWCAQNKKLAWLLEDDTARRQFRAAFGTASTNDIDAGSHRHCHICSRVDRSFRSVKHCQLCSAWVCSRCRVARKLSAADESLVVTQRVVEVCKTCVGRVAAADAREIALAQYAAVDKRERMKSVKHRALSTGSDATLSGTLRYLDVDSGGDELPTTHSPHEPVVETIDDWARASRVQEPTSQDCHDDLDHDRLLHQMQTLCLAAEETYQYMALTASRVLERRRPSDGA